MAKEGWGTKAISTKDLIPDMTFEGIFTSYIWLWKVITNIIREVKDVIILGCNG